jgi:hypothetical protein
MKRESGTRGGYNCGPGGRDCQHDPKGDHGIDGGVWWYVVSNGPRAVSLMVLATNFPESVDRAISALLKGPLATQLLHHIADPEGRECQYVEGGLCSCDGSYMAGSMLWKEYGDPTKPEQPEAFWLALEAELQGGAE